MSLGDLLHQSKLKKVSVSNSRNRATTFSQISPCRLTFARRKPSVQAYFKATLILHPDKTSDLDPDSRFIANAVFDVLCRAKEEAGV